ncbi:Defensin-like protein [Gossypium arboreum]|uniref:Defensin-like protein n=1 Tax=Gossypium arboreum TaxID=29729 RepID=A0A0B0NEX0_GOSAR|nr:Defensin-like protein [Gossypium arboreum]
MVCSCCSFGNFLVLIVASCIRNFQGIFYQLSLSSMCGDFFLFFMFSFFNDPDSDLFLISCVYWGMVVFPAHTSKALSSLMSINPSRLSPNDAPLSTPTKLWPFEQRSLV